MPIPLLATKLYIPPPRPKVVRRPHLIEQLNVGLHGQLTLISAPAGFGKTTLVSAWLNQREEAEETPHPPSSSLHPSKVAWLSLDEGDSDLTRFLTYLVAALQTLAPQIGAGVLGLLQSPQPPQDPSAREAMLTALLNEITTISDGFVLVLDDYHRIDDTAVDQSLAFLLDHLPPQMHVVITTREDPQLPLARYRARGQMTELRAADLRFTPAEAAAFLNQVMGLDLSAEEVTVLEERTEGWIAGLQLAALSMRGRADVAHFVKAFTGDNRYIVDYLVEEVLRRQPERVRSFLLQTAILDRLSGSLCDAVTEHKDSMALLDVLERSNLFVVPLDDNRHWFRYHHLFADVLAAHALQEQPAQIPILHQRASNWYEQHGLRADAIRHALAAQAFGRAADLIERAWPDMDGRFQTATWLGWARSLPYEVVRIRPVLSAAYGWAFLNSGALEAAETHLLDAERWLDTGLESAVIVDEEQFRNLPASIATARAYQSQARGDIPNSVKYGQQALDLLPVEDHLRRGPAAALLALAQWASGDLEAAYQTLAEAMANFQKVGNLHFAISGTYGLGDIRTVQGRLHDAIKVYTQVLQLALAQHQGAQPLLRGTADLYLGLSELYREQGDRDAAIWNLQYGEKLGDQAALPDWRYRLCRTQARFKETAGDLAGALDLLNEAERHYRRTPVPAVRPLPAMRVRVWVAQGRLHEARRWVQEHSLSVDDELSFLREFEHITLARVLLAEYARDPASSTIRDAMNLLDRLQQAAEAGGRMGSVIEIGVLQALAHQAQGNRAAALVALEHALRLAEPEGYVRIFVDEGAPLAHLLSAAAVQGIMPDYIGKLLAAFVPVEAVAQSQPELTPDKVDLPSAALAQPLIEPLSERELEVLRLLATELNGPEIARQLMVSLNTVRTHTKNIFNKLGVNSRRAAIRRATELRLL